MRSIVYHPVSRVENIENEDHALPVDTAIVSYSIDYSSFVCLYVSTTCFDVYAVRPIDRERDKFTVDTTKTTENNNKTIKLSTKRLAKKNDGKSE